MKIYYTMKIYSSRLLAGVVILLGLVGCIAPEGENSGVAKAGGSEMELYANSLSRTSNEGLNTLWSEGDKINIFHSAAGNNSYVNDGVFALVNGFENRFVGSLNEKSGLLSSTTYDWFASYPYKSLLKSPNGDGADFVIASLSTSCQVQQGNDNTSHIAGEYMPLVGVAKGVSANVPPAITVKNVASMVEVILQNNSDQAVAVKSVSFSVKGCNLVGSFSIDFRDAENIVCTPVEGKVSDRATLQIENGAGISSQSQASFYMAVAPFVAKSGAVISFDITLQTSEGEKVCSKSQTLTADVTFHSGKSKPVILNYDQELNIEELPIGGLPPMQGGGQSRIFSTRVMSYNIRNGKGMDGVQDFQRIIDAVNRAKVDVVAVQEVDSMTTRNPKDVLKLIGEATGMYSTFGGAINYGGGKYGVGVLSKEKPLSYYRVPLPCSNEPRVLLVVELQNYYFCSTHYSLLAEYREEASRIICEEAKKLNKPMIVAGDFNALRTATPMLMMAEHFDIFEKNGSQLTFPADAPTKEIDYICLYKDNGAVSVITESYVQYEPLASDHRPIVMEMTICE